MANTQPANKAYRPSAEKYRRTQVLHRPAFRFYTALLLCGVMAVSAVGMGFAKWQTTVTAGGNVSTAGKWDVEMTDASVTLSSGAQLRENDADYGLQNVCAQKVYGQACIEAAVPRTKLTSFPATGTQNSRFTMSSWLWLVDTTRFDLSRLGTIGTEERRQLMLDGLADGSVIRLSDDQTAPDLSDDVLAPGQSCTVQVVVQALDNGSDTLDTSGALKIDLPYSQAAVEPAPQAGHQHS